MLPWHNRRIPIVIKQNKLLEERVQQRLSSITTRESTDILHATCESNTSDVTSTQNNIQLTSLRPQSRCVKDRKAAFGKFVLCPRQIWDAFSTMHCLAIKAGANYTWLPRCKLGPIFCSIPAHGRAGLEVVSSACVVPVVSGGDLKFRTSFVEPDMELQLFNQSLQHVMCVLRKLRG